MWLCGYVDSDYAVVKGTDPVVKDEHGEYTHEHCAKEFGALDADGLGKIDASELEQEAAAAEAALESPDAPTTPLAAINAPEIVAGGSPELKLRGSGWRNKLAKRSSEAALKPAGGQSLIALHDLSAKLSRILADSLAQSPLQSLTRLFLTKFVSTEWSDSVRQECWAISASASALSVCYCVPAVHCWPGVGAGERGMEAVGRSLTASAVNAEPTPLTD